MDRDNEHLRHFNSRNKRETMAPRPTMNQWLSDYDDTLFLSSKSPREATEPGPQIDGRNWLHVGSNVIVSKNNVQNQKKNVHNIMKDSMM
jgi:hypothetical protein